MRAGAVQRRCHRGGGDRASEAGAIPMQLRAGGAAGARVLSPGALRAGEIGAGGAVRHNSRATRAGGAASARGGASARRGARGARGGREGGARGGARGARGVAASARAGRVTRIANTDATRCERWRAATWSRRTTRPASWARHRPKRSRGPRLFAGRGCAEPSQAASFELRAKPQPPATPQAVWGQPSARVALWRQARDLGCTMHPTRRPLRVRLGGALGGKSMAPRGKCDDALGGDVRSPLTEGGPRSSRVGMEVDLRSGSPRPGAEPWPS